MTTYQATVLDDEDHRFICVCDWEEVAGWDSDPQTIWVNWCLYSVVNADGCRPEDLEHFLTAIRDATRTAASHLTSSECDWSGP